uniref:Uncharacterized protein n=1 Tax=Timema douglasi TaxID=61478 RepID=A0A7R8Z7H6_TIMDO|nr:unnamed protein product [Timema douglasi]
MRSDEDDPSGSKYTRMEEESIQDKERFARINCNLLANTHVIVPPSLPPPHPSSSLPLPVERVALNAANDKPRPQKAVNVARQLEKFTGKNCVDFTESSRAGKALLTADVNFVIVGSWLARDYPGVDSVMHSGLGHCDYYVLQKTGYTEPYRTTFFRRNANHEKPASVHRTEIEFRPPRHQQLVYCESSALETMRPPKRALSCVVSWAALSLPNDMKGQRLSFGRARHRGCVGARRRAMSWPWLQAVSPSFPPPSFTWRLRQPLERSADRGNGSGHDLLLALPLSVASSSSSSRAGPQQRTLSSSYLSRNRTCVRVDRVTIDAGRVGGLRKEGGCPGERAAQNGLLEGSGLVQLDPLLCVYNDEGSELMVIEEGSGVVVQEPVLMDAVEIETGVAIRTGRGVEIAPVVTTPTLAVDRAIRKEFFELLFWHFVRCIHSLKAYA